MANTYTLIERITTPGVSGPMVFNNIPQGYTDLVIRASVKSSATSQYDYAYLKFNGDSTTANYGNRDNYYLNGAAGSEVYVGPSTTGMQVAFIASSASYLNQFNNLDIRIPNYSSNLQKIVLTESYSGGVGSGGTGNGKIIGIGTNTWSGSAPITNISITCSGNTWAANTTFSLYGVAAIGANPTKAPKATGGAIIETDGTYWYHAWPLAGTYSFTPQTYGMSADILVIGGGGSGGSRVGGGGGAGAVLPWYSQPLTYNTSYSLTVGAGGTGVLDTASGSRGVAGNVGGASQFASLTASAGGGGGGAYTQVNAVSGASGGGAGGYNTGAAATGASGTSGNNGGNGVTAAAGGGGGAGTAGAAGVTSVNQGGVGGAGTNTFASWVNICNVGVSGYVAAGGGGSADTTAGAGGLGGGGAGTTGTIQPAISGNNGTGSGGGGVRDSTDAANYLSGAGGSGLIIVRYTV